MRETLDGALSLRSSLLPPLCRLSAAAERTGARMPLHGPTRATARTDSDPDLYDLLPTLTPSHNPARFVVANTCIV